MAKGKQPLLYVLSSVASWAVDTGGFFVLSLLFGGMLGAYSEPVCNVAARVISSFFNFNLNNRLVFQNSGSYGKALLRYYCLAVPQLAASTLLLTLLVRLLGIETFARDLEQFSRGISFLRHRSQDRGGRMPVCGQLFHSEVLGVSTRGKRIGFNR